MIMSDEKKDILEREKKPVDISEKYTKSKRKITEIEIESLKKIAELDKGPDIDPEEATVLDILTKRKFLDQITREVNLARKPFGKKLIEQSRIIEILNSLESKKLIKKIKVPKGVVWVSVEHIRYKVLGSDKL